MRLPKRVCLAFLLFLVSLNLILRYPRTPHELDYDGFVFHGMIRFLVADGYATWIIHPLSYFGLYPLSHPGGGLFLVGSLTQVSGIPIEGSILLLDFVVVVVGLLGAFALSMELRKNELLALLVSAAFSLAPTFVTSLMWSVPARTLFTALIPSFIWSVLRWQRTKEVRWLSLVGAILVLMMSAHRLTVLMGVVLIAFVLTMMLFVIEKLNALLLQGADVVGALIVLVASSGYIVNYILQTSLFVDDWSYTHGLYVLQSTRGSVIANDGVLGSEIFLASGHPYLPVGGATTAFQSPELLIFGFVDKNNLRVYPVPVTDLTVDSDTPFTLVGVQAAADWVQILDGTPGSIPSRLYATYSPTFLAENWDTWGGYTAYGHVYGSPFINAVHQQSYKAFEIQGQTLWYLGEPT